MKTTKRIICLLICVLSVIAAPISASARGAVYSKPSDVYKKSQYAKNLYAVELTGDMRRDVIAVAISQLFYHEGDSEKDFNGLSSSGDGNFVEYNYAYGKLDQDGDGSLSYGYPWCAAFVSFCLRRALVPTSIAPTHVNCTSWVNIFKKGVNDYRFFAPSGYDPIMGDIIFFKTNSGTTRISDHVGLVLGASDTHVYTIEGNTSGGVFTRTYERGDGKIIGYAVPNYESEISAGEKLDDSRLVVSARETLNLRAQGSTSSAIITTLTYGTAVEVISVKNGWANVRTDGKTGWASMTYLIPEQFKRIKVTYNDGSGAQSIFVGSGTLFGIDIPKAEEGEEFCGFEANGKLYNNVKDGRIVLSSDENVDLKAEFEKIAPETTKPETETAPPDIEAGLPADTYEEWLESLPPEVTAGCASAISGGASIIAACAVGALLLKKKKRRS